MNIVIVGYGKMGHEIETVIKESTEHNVQAIAVKTKEERLTMEHLDGADVVIDFSSAELMPSHTDLYCKAGINAVIGTTGWTYDKQALDSQIRTAGNCIIVGSNFSSSVQTFLAIVRYASRRLNALGDYDVFGYEAHHRHKADSPSGTAKTLAETILNEMDSKDEILYGNAEGMIREDQLQIVSSRGGRNSGLHNVIYENGTDQIEISHQAFSRAGFAKGAVQAAEYAVTQKGLIFYEQLFNEGEVYG